MFLSLTFLQLNVQTRNGVFEILEYFLLHIKIFGNAQSGCSLDLNFGLFFDLSLKLLVFLFQGLDLFLKFVDLCAHSMIPLDLLNGRSSWLVVGGLRIRNRGVVVGGTFEPILLLFGASKLDTLFLVTECIEIVEDCTLDICGIVEIKVAIFILFAEHFVDIQQGCVIFQVNVDLLRHSWLAVASLFEFVKAAIQFITVIMWIDLVKWPVIVMHIIVIFILVLFQLFHIPLHLVLVEQRRWELLTIPDQFLR